ncbi:MAG TPA: hypothetical protein VF275_13095 [Gammaproteobacteria bacterium]
MNIQNNSLRFFCLSVVFLLLSGCAATGSWLRDIERPLLLNQPDLALQALEAAGGSEKDAALYLVNKGILLRMSGDIAGSIQAFEAAKPLITFQEATSITDFASSLTLTEGSDGYQPPAFEQVQLHFYQALNRMDMGDWEGARVEAMQINILLERRWDGIAPFGGDAAARFLTGIIFEGVGESDNALIAYRKAYEAYKDRSTIGGVPVELQRRLLLLTKRNGFDQEFETFAAEFGEARKLEALATLETSGDMGEIILVASTGLIPHRYEASTTQMDPTSGKVYTMALPALSQPLGTIMGVSLQRGGELLGKAHPLVDLSVLSQKTLDDQLPGLIAKSIARNVVKNAGANQVEEQFGLLGGLLANVAAAATEAADIRCWNTLPQYIQVLSVRVKPGTYSDLAIEYGNAVREPLGQQVSVNAGAPTVVSVHRVAL